MKVPGISNTIHRQLLEMVQAHPKLAVVAAEVVVALAKKASRNVKILRENFSSCPCFHSNCVILIHELS